MKKVVATIRNLDDDEEIRIFDSYDDIFGLYDYTEEFVISETTYTKLCTGDYYAKRYGKTIRAYSF